MQTKIRLHTQSHDLMARKFVVTLLIALSPVSLATADESLQESVSPLVNSSCIDCHDADTDTRLNFEKLSDDLTDPAVFRQWEQVFDRVTTGEMPPKSEPRPDSTQVTDALAKLKDSLKPVIKCILKPTHWIGPWQKHLLMVRF